MPSTAFAFARVDLDPDADQKVAIHEFAKKFPGGPKTTAGDPIDAILTELFKEDTIKDKPECNYEALIKPWLGKRIGVAAIPGAGGKTQPLLVIQVKDKDKAAAAKTTLTGDACGTPEPDETQLRGFTMVDDYAVLSTTQADVDGAIAATKTKSLKNADHFAKDIATLEDNQIVVAWADLTRAFAAASKEAPKLGMVPNSIAAEIKGRVVVGMHMGNDFAELTGNVIDGPPIPGEASGDASTIKALPKNTVVAISASGVQKQLQDSLKKMQDSGLPLDDMLEGAGKAYGLNIQEDLLPLLGSTMTLSVGEIPEDNPLDAEFGLQSTVEDPAKAAAIGKKLSALAKQQGVPVEAQVKGNTFYLTSKGYAAELQKDGGLGDSPIFVKAMGDLSGKLTGAAYVDFATLAKFGAGTGAGEDLEHLSAIGVTARVDEGIQKIRMRLVVK